MTPKTIARGISPGLSPSLSPRTLLIGCLAMLAAACLGHGARATELLAALPATASSALATQAARPVAAWVEFCERYAGECAIDPSEPALIALTPRVWTTIITVNRRVNAALRPLTDQEHWGVPDRWDLAEDGAGDCEDYQLLKRHRLAEAGLPRRAMRVAVVVDEKGEGHAVLMLRTDRGDFVLDNKTSAVVAWNQTGYTFVKRESQDRIGWVALGGTASPIVTANR